MAVIGAPHPHWGEAITAIVLPRPGMQPSEADLRAWRRAHPAGFKVPKGIVFVAEFPRTGTGTGKVQKHLLRDRLVAHHTTP